MINNKKKLALISLLMACVMTMTSCNIDMNAIEEGVSDLREAVSSEEAVATETTTAPTAEETEATETSSEEEIIETEAEEEVVEEVIPTSTPTPTPRPTATPTPAPERVDFAELTEIEINDIITVEKEDFSESYVTDSDIVVATFSGSRLLISSEDNVRVANAINLILDGFYQEAAGLYARYTNEGLAVLELEGEEDDTDLIATDVNVSFAYSDNGRVLSVIMKYSVMSEDDVIDSAYEYVSFDMLTGQYVTLALVANDYNGLNEALAEAIADYTEDDRDDAEDYTDICIVAQTPGAETATAEVYGTIDGEVVHTTVNLNDYSEYLNRFGRTIYGVE